MGKGHTATTAQRRFTCATILLFLLLAPAWGWGQTTIFSDNFETGYSVNTGLNTSGANQWLVKVISGSSVDTWAIGNGVGALSGTKGLTIYRPGSGYAVYDNQSSTEQIAYRKIDASYFTGVSIGFSWKCLGESGYDYGKVVYSLDGTTWNDVSATEYCNSSTKQTESNLAIPAVDGKQFYIGFRWKCDSSMGDDPSFTVDDIVIKGNPTTPKLTTIPSSIDFGFIASGESSSSNYFDLTGSNLTGVPGNITVTAPAGFEVSNNSSTGFGSSVSISYSSSSLSWKRFYVRFKPTAKNTTYSDNITISGGGATQTMALSGSSVIPYCNSSGDPTIQRIGINDVQFNTISNSSGSSFGYEDYTSNSTTLIQGNNYNFTIQVSKSWGSYRTYAYVWIDWNQNGIFTDGERYDLGYASGNGATSLSPLLINIPSTAALGSTRMRVSAKYDGYPASCGTGFNGEVEDYTINVVPAATTYYSRGGDPTKLLSWSTSATGPINSPASFTTNNQIFVVQNNMEVNTAWSVSGTGTKLQVQGGAALTANAPITLSPATTFQLDANATYNHNVANDAVWAGTEVIAATSTVVYGATGVQNVVVPAGGAYGNLTISGGGTKTMQGDVAVGGTLNLQQGALAINGQSLTLSGKAIGAAATGTIKGSATSKLTVNGNGSLGSLYFTAGAQQLNNLTINRTTSGMVALGTPLTVNGILTLTSGLLQLGDNDLTIISTGTIAGAYSSTTMVETNGSGSLVKEGNANGDFAMTYPVGTGSSYTPMQLSSLSVATVAPGAWVKVRSVATIAPNAIGVTPLTRHWITATNGFSGSLLADVRFSYVADDVPAGTTGKHDMVYQPAAGAWAFPGGASVMGSNPLTASAATSLDATWTATIPDRKTFYSLKSGSWDEPTTWTLDPSGTQPLNPNGLTPSTSVTAPFDEVVILSGRTVTVPTNTKQNKRINVVGTLDLGTTTGHLFTKVDGTGRIRLAGDNFPAGNASDFTTAGQGQGTVEYYGLTRSIITPRTFYSVEVNMDANQALTLLKNHTLNGNLTVTNGTFSINDNVAATPLAITVSGDVNVASTGKIITGSANARHQLNLYGNFTNSGEVKFTNRIVANYADEALDGMVDVNFLNTAASQSVLCKGITNFYRIEVDKGADATYTLSVDATAPANFNLFGYANENHAAIAQLAANNNALGLVRGTVRIGNSIAIPTLSTASNYSISEAAQLWVNGGTVQKNSGQTIAVYGKLKTSTGLLEAKTQNGITLCSNGSLNVDGGTVNINQLRTSDVAGGPHNGAYIQTGGAVNVLGGTTNTGHYVFSLPSTASVFNMSGGTLKVNTSTGKGAILINSDPDNVKVTGGTVIAETASSDDFTITSRAPFWNLEMRSTGTGSGLFKLGAATNIGIGAVSVAAQPLKVLNDFRIWGQESGGAGYKAITFDPFTPAANDVYIGGSIYIEKGATYKAVSIPVTLQNTTYFNKTAGTNAVEELYWGDTANPLELGKLVVDRTAGYEVKVTSASGRANESVAIDVNGNASVLSGILNQNLYTVRTWGAIVNNGRMGTWYPGVTPSHAQIQIVENPALTLTTSTDAVFGNVQINVTPPNKLTLTSDTYIERMEYVKGLIYLKGYNLKVDNLWNMNTGLFENSTGNSYLSIANSGASGSSMIFTDGKASDGGLSLKVTTNSQAENQNSIINNFGPITYPVGFTTDGGVTTANLYFRPAQMVVKNYSDDGYVTIRPVFGSLQTTDQAGGEVLQHYWRVSHSGFTAAPTVAYRFYYRNQMGVANVDLPTGATTVSENTYLPGKVLDESPYTRGSETSDDIIKTIGGGNSRFITVNGTSGGGLFTPSVNGITLENANYTAGVQDRFTGSVLIYYTRDEDREVRWNNTRAWTRSDMLNPLFAPHDSRQRAAGVIPGAGDVAVIGWIPWTDTNRPVAMHGQPHGVWIDDNTQQVAEVVFTKMTDKFGNPVPRNYRSNFQFRPTLCINGANGQLMAKMVKGEGMFWNRGSDPNYTQMDIGDFARQDSSYVLYENFVDDRIVNNTAPLFPNLCISNDGWGSQNHDFSFSRDIVTTGNLEILGSINLLLPTGASGNITVGRNLKLFEVPNPIEGSPSGGGAEVAFQNTGTPRKVTVKGDLLMVNGGSIIHVRNADGSPVDHELHVEGNIIQGTATLASAGLDLWSDNNYDRITLFLDGSNSMMYSRLNGAVPNLYRLVVNKGTNKDTEAQFNTDYTLNGPTSGVGVAKALELRNGTFISNNPTAARILYLTKGNDHFDIPSTAGLNIRQGTARASGTSGIALDGTLTVSGGTLDMTGGENPIEYSASGNATIAISSGNLNVGGQIRRSLTSDAGILSYNQTGGSVVVGQNAATANDRGVFEILNAGSSFTMTAGDLYIARAQTSPEVAAFYFNPAAYDIKPAANIHIGHITTPAAQTIGIYAGKPLPSLRVNNQSGSNPTAQLQVVPATISSLLTIDAGAAFDANGLGLTLNGDMSCKGTFLPKGNTTYLSGSGTQTITGSGTATNFFNLDKTSSSNVTLAASTPLLVTNELLLRAGTFTTGSNTVTVKGNMLNDATHVYGGDITGYGILLNGDVNQILTGNGTFGKLSINNPNGVDVPVANQLKITKGLKMQAGVFNIGKNLLDLGTNALIEQASTFSKSNMITTNISFTDNGVRKFFPAGAQPNFIFPVGSANKYTPVTIKVNANSSAAGSITVKPANEMHPSIVEDAEVGTEIVDKDNALQYYWTLKTDNLSGFSGTAKMKYLDADVKVTTYTVADYFTARLLSDGSGQWNKFSKNDFDEGVAKELTFTFSNTDDKGVSGDYTAGAGDNTLNGAIPDNVSKFETNSSGDWTAGTIWTPNVTGGPRGAIAKINTLHTVDVTTNFLAGYMTEVYGTLKLYSTFGHRLGIVNGNGTISTELGDIPAAVYDDFFSSAGGTLEFGGTAKSYEFLGNIFEVNHLKISGSGERRFPNNNLTLNGDLTIAGTSGLSLLNYYNRKISIKGDVNRTSGSFDAGSGATATLSLVGTGLQTINGSFSDNNALNNLEINNANGVSITNDVEIDRELKLTNGLINVTIGSLFKMNYGAFVTPIAGSKLSFVNGVLTKEMMTGNSFIFPIGNNTGTVAYGPISLLNVSGPAGINRWNASYFFANPTDVGLPVANFATPISTVSNSEYWKVQAPAGGQSVISIALDGSSDVGSTITDLNNLRIVGWNTTTSKWEVVGSGSTISGISTDGSIATTSPVSFGSYTYFTLASITPLSVSSASFTSPSTVNLCSGTPTTMSVAFSGTAPWVLTYTAGAATIVTPALATSPYNITVTPSATTVYTLTGITANGVAGTITGTTAVTVNVSPMPTVVVSIDGGVNTICEGSPITFTATSGLDSYRFRDNGVIVQTGDGTRYKYTPPTALTARVHSIDVIGRNSGGCSATSSAVVVTVNPKPAAAGLVAGDVSVCNGSSPDYTVPAIANATSYIWTLSNGATITTPSSPPYTNTIKIKFINSGLTTISVKGNNSCGDGATSTLPINVSSGVAVTVQQNINSGPVSVCQGGTSYKYTVPAITNATGYKWYYSGGGATDQATGTAVASGAGAFTTITNTITLNFSASATGGSLTVQGVSGCSTGDGPLSTIYPIAVNTPPTATIVPLAPSVCSGTPLTITATSAGGTTPYISHLWTGVGAASLSSSAVTNPSFTNATGGSYALTYTVTDTKGCVGVATTTVMVNQAPVADAGPDATGLCTGNLPIQLAGATATGSYSGTPTWTGTGGDWTQNPVASLATFTPSTASGSTTATLTLTGTNGCSSVFDTRAISWSKVPAQPGSFTAFTTTACKGQSNVNFTVPDDPLATSYSWSYSGTGATIVPTRNQAYVTFSSTATDGTISVTATNGCGTSSARTQAVTVSQCTPLKPGTPTTASSSICYGTATTDISITSDPAGAEPNSYIWRINPPAAGAIASKTKNATIVWAASFSGSVDVIVNAANASGPGPNSDPVSIDVVKVNAGTIESSIGDPACFKLGTPVSLTSKVDASVNPSAAAAYSWEMLLDDGSGGWKPSWQIVTGVNAATHSISSMDIGAQKVLKMQVRRVASSSGCSNVSNAVTINRLPITGPPYHVGNSVAK